LERDRRKRLGKSEDTRNEITEIHEGELDNSNSAGKTLEVQNNSFNNMCKSFFKAICCFC